MQNRLLSLIRPLLPALAIAVGFAAMVQIAAAAEAPASETQRYVDAMQPGWNIGNTLDSTGNDETSWGQPRISRDLFKALVANGYKSVRIPITWMRHIGGAPDYTVNKDYMDRVQEVVDMALAENLYVLINIHHDSGDWVIKMENQHDQVLNKFNALWSQISDRFRDYPQKLSFESINEPRFSQDWGKDTPKYFAMLDELNMSCHDIVRKSGGGNATRPLVISTMTASASQARLDETFKTMAMMNDQNLIATVHYYGYYPFSVGVAGVSTFDAKVRKNIETTFDRAFNTFTAKGIPVIVGEFGILGYDKSLDVVEHGEALKFFEYLCYYTSQKHMTTMLWDNGQHLNRGTLKWGDQSRYEVMKAGFNGGRSSSTELDAIYIKNGAAIKDIVVKVNLNGNALAAIENGATALAQGADYDIQGDALTLKAGLLNRILSRNYGINATLTCKFSSGADWSMYLIWCDTPTLKGATGTARAFAIPTVFNGDRLRSMESAYKAGGNAGPDEWTPYKGFLDSVTPDYSAGTIVLSRKYLSAVKDGEIVLKMHFWSGAVVEYVITKKGSAVTGVCASEAGNHADAAGTAETPAGATQHPGQ